MIDMGWLEGGCLPSVFVVNQAEFNAYKQAGLLSDADVESGAVVIIKGIRKS